MVSFEWWIRSIFQTKYVRLFQKNSLSTKLNTQGNAKANMGTAESWLVEWKLFPVNAFDNMTTNRIFDTSMTWTIQRKFLNLLVHGPMQNTQQKLIEIRRNFQAGILGGCFRMYVLALDRRGAHQRLNWNNKRRKECLAKEVNFRGPKTLADLQKPKILPLTCRNQKLWI